MRHFKDLHFLTSAKRHAKGLVLLVLLLCCSAVLWAQKIQVTGVVTDDQNTPVSGASVVVKGTTIGTFADNDGRYSISADPQSTLVFSFIGYPTIEAAVSGRTTVNAQMASDGQVIEEVVIVGYGAVRKRDVTGAISSVTSASIEERIPIDVFDALQGQTAGVQITSGSGAPGETSAVRIRGTATFGDGVSPLYVVDGVPMSGIDDINPADIESIEVLKDAASAAIYGSRSANGVIIVTTKQGDKNKPSVSVKYLHSWSQMSHKMPQVTPDDVRYYYKVRDLYGLGSMTPADSTGYFANANTDYQAELFETATRDQVDVSGSGGADNMKYFLSAGFLQDKGVIRNSDYTRITARMNVDYNVTKKLTIGNRTSFSVSSKNGIDEATVLGDLLGRNANWQLYNPDGSFVPVIQDRRNPVAQAELEVKKSQLYKTTVYNYFTYSIIPDLKFTSNLTGVLDLGRSQDFRPTILIGSGGKTYGNDISDLDLSYTNENYFNYAHKFGKKHNFSALLGCSFQWWGKEYSRIRGEDYATDEIYTISAASTIIANQTTAYQTAHSMASFFSRASYDYMGKYLVSANLRYDGSSRFGDNTKWGLFPSISGGWRFSDEFFFEWAKPALSDGKVRVSYGVTGNEAIGNYDAQQTYSPGSYYMGVSGVAPTRLASPDLGWEQTTQFNVGLDLALLKNRLRVTADYYDKITDNLLYNVQLPKETGFSTVRQNIGSMENIGFEFAVEGNIIAGKDWRWSAAFNISTNVSTILKLAEGTPFYTGSSVVGGANNAIYVEEGGLVGNFWGRYQEGIFAYDESNAFDDSWNMLKPVFENGVFARYLDGQGNVYTGGIQQKMRPDGTPFGAGDVNWRDVKRDGVVDGVIDDKDIINLGNSQPDYFGGFNTTLSYKGISLFVSLYYSMGGEIYNAMARNRNSFSGTSRVPAPDIIHSMWTKPGDEALYPRPENVSHNIFSGPTNMWMEDASYIKLRTVKLTYSLPSKFAQRIYLKGLSAYIYGNNLLTWTAYKGYDPEFSSGNALTQGIDTGRYPRKREYGLGINVNF